MPNEFKPGNRMAAGYHNRGDRTIGKPYSDAAREFLSMVWGDGKTAPEAWGERSGWSAAQVLVERQAMIAMAGSLDTTKWLVERAEGKSAMAPEDRAAVKGAAAANLLGGMAALNALRMAVGLPQPIDPLDSEEVPDLARIDPPKVEP